MTTILITQCLEHDSPTRSGWTIPCPTGCASAPAKADRLFGPEPVGGMGMLCQRQLKSDQLAASENWPPSWLWFVGRGGWDAAEVSVFEPVGVAFEGDDFGVVD